MKLMRAKELSKETGIPCGTLYDWVSTEVIPPTCYCKPTKGTLFFFYEKFLEWLTNTKAPNCRKVGITL